MCHVTRQSRAVVRQRRDVEHGNDVNHGARHGGLQLVQRDLDVVDVVVRVIVVLQTDEYCGVTVMQKYNRSINVRKCNVPVN